MKKLKLEISQNTSNRLFLSNLTKENGNKPYLDSLEHKLNFIRNRDIAKKQEEKKAKKKPN